MKVFVTGGTGFIGRRLVRRMSNTMHTVRCLVREGSDTRELEGLGVTFVKGDLADMKSLRAGMDGCDWVVNLASENSLWQPDMDVYRRVNVEGTRNVMECALECDISKVVHVSSVEVYGKPRESPIRERTQEGLFRFSRFSQTRFDGDHLAWLLYRDKYLPLVTVYPCVALGSGDDGHAGRLIRGLLDRRMPIALFPSTTFTFVHVDDVAEIIIRAAEKTDNFGERYIAGNARLTLRDFYDLVSDVSDVPTPFLRIPDALVMACARTVTRIADTIGKPPLFGLSTDAARTMMEGFRADGSKAESELGISYTPIRQAVEEECAWYMRERGRTWKGEERRGETRSRVDVPCDMKGWSHGMETMTKAQVIDLTRHGMFVAADTPLDEGSDMDAEISLLQFGSTFWVRGKVLRLSQEGMAVKFNEKVPLDIERLMK